MVGTFHTQAGPGLDPAREWTPFVPDARRPWDLRRAGHLYRRAAFGASWAQLEQAVADGPAKAVDRLVHPGPDASAFNRDFDAYEQRGIDPGTTDLGAFHDWWLRRLMQSPHPLLESMTLFWHDHFAVSNRRVKSGWLMARHVGLLRAGALGRLGPLFSSVVRDPALLLSHGAARNRRAAPEQSVARVWLKRFTVGPGVATERDVTETARAFTGRGVLRLRYQDLAHEHDPGVKTVLGSEGKWTDADVARITAGHPATARQITRRVYRWLVSEADEPSDALLAPLSDQLAADGDFGRLVETVLRSNRFHSADAYRQKVKGPVALAIGLIRSFEGVVPTAPLATALADLGQDLGQPPSSAGWPGGTSWINRGTVIGRVNLTAALVSGQPPFGPKLDPLAIARTHDRAAPEDARKWLADLLLQGDPPDDDVRRPLAAVPAEDPAAGLRAAAAALSALPEYQLA